MILRLFLIWLIFAWCEPFSDACETVTESADTMDCGLLTEAMAPVAALTQAADTVAVIMNPADQAPDDIYAGEEMVVTDTLAVIRAAENRFPVVEMATSAGVFAFSALFVGVEPFVSWRHEAQKHISQHGRHKTEVDNYLQYLPLVTPFVLDVCGVKGEHRFLDKVLLTGMSYATFAVLNNVAKYTFREKRPNSPARNSFPSGHTGTVVTGAEILRREYWNTNKWLAMSGYVVAAGVAYLRIHNDRHWINDVVGGAAVGFLSTTFAYWIYPKIFRKRAAIHYNDLLIRQRDKGRPAGEMVVAAPFVTDGGGGLALSYTF